MRTRIVVPIMALLLPGCASTQDVEIPLVYSGSTLTGQAGLGYQGPMGRLCGWPFESCAWKVDIQKAQANALAACRNAEYQED